MKRCDILNFILALEVNAVNSVCGVYSWMEKGILGGKIRRMKLYLVRHGETDWNKVKRIQGQVDIPLNQFGKRLAEETAEGLRDIPFDLCISSPLSRAHETARIILYGKDIPIIKDARIEEMAFGEYEGKCCARDNWELPEDFHKFFNDPAGFVPGKGGESFADVKKRTGEFLKSLYKKTEGVYENILITTHGAALAGMLNNIRKEPLEKYWGIEVHSNCGVTEVEVKNGEATILSENVTYYEETVRPWADK